jgi:hypothetical protein
MKRLLLFTVVVFLAFAFHGYAGMKGKEGKMMDGQMGKGAVMKSENDMMSGGEHKSGEMKMMKDKEMMHKMAPCMQDMQKMTDRMNMMMEKEMNGTDREKLADIMKDMSKHMNDMSVMMKKGYCTMGELEKIDRDIGETQERFEELDAYL